jgi:hypothetical protein
LFERCLRDCREVTGDGFQFVGAAREGRQNLVDLRAEFTDGSVDTFPPRSASGGLFGFGLFEMAPGLSRKTSTACAIAPTSS